MPKPGKRSETIFQPAARHATLEVQNPDVSEAEFFFHCLAWVEIECRDEAKLLACIPSSRKDEFFSSEQRRAGFDANLTHHKTTRSTAQDIRRDFESIMWKCTACARRGKVRRARQQAGVLGIINAKQQQKLAASSPEDGSGVVTISRVSKTDLGKACSSVACAYSLTIKVYQCDPTRAFVEVSNSGKHCKKGCTEHMNHNSACHGHPDSFCPLRCSAETRELCRALLSAHVPNKQIVESALFNLYVRRWNCMASMNLIVQLCQYTTCRSCVHFVCEDKHRVSHCSSMYRS
jgi:hypothetical protein